MRLSALVLYFQFVRTFEFVVILKHGIGCADEQPAASLLKIMISKKEHPNGVLFVVLRVE